MFDELYSSYRNIISNIAIIGYSENDILNRGNNLNKQLELKCLFIYPNSDEKSYNELTYEMMFPEGNHKIECPKFFSLGLTDEKGKRTFLYCLKFPEKFKLCNNNNITEINVPLVICIKSEKSDLEPFRQLLTSINQIIVSENLDYDSKIMNNYKKVELMNILYFIFSLPHTPPHSLIRLKLNNDICEVEDEIDFYFSSNCELPCNKNDTDVNLLFLILDQSIIIKVIIAILSEKQIVFRASQAYLLHLIIPTFLKLIFPFKWIHSCITILGKENIDFLDTPGSFIFGILSYTIQTQEILDRYPGVIIVDCDTNEIFGENNTDPFVAPKDTNNEDSNLKGSKKSKHKSKNKEIYDNISGGIKQGKNIFIVQGSYIYLYDPETKGKGPKMKFTEKNNIIIDTQKGQFLINKSNGFINSEEWKWLRKNIQLVRNPEIFDIENIDSKKKKSFESKYLNENESPILPNRSFSYNIQNILMHFYLKKISETNSEFMEYFKSTNLYLNYLNQSPFQNNSGHRIIENIKETINDPRSIDNCFIVEYNKRPFYCLSLLDELEKKIIELKAEIFGSCNSSINLNNSNNSNLKNEVMLTEKEKKDKFEYYSQLKNILMDYCLVLGINFGQGKNDIFNNDDSGLPRISLSSNKSKLNHFKNNYHKGHKKSNNSLLQFTFNQNPNFNLAGIDKFSKNFFKFYGKDGFLYFLKDFEEFMRETRKDFENTIFKMKIYQQLINIYKNLDNIFKRSKKENEDEINIDIDDLNKDFNEEEEEENEEEINLLNNIPKNINNENNKNDEIKDEENNENKEENNNSFIENEEKDDSNFLNLGNKKIIDDLRSITSIRKTKNSVMSMIAEKDEENESYIERTTTKKFTNKSNNEELGNTLLNNINLKIEENLNDENENIQKDEIIVFPYFEHKKEKEYNDFINQIFDNNSNKNKNDKNLTQYYLFLAYYLEEITSDNFFLDKFNKDISKYLGTQININKLIFKLYKEAYINSGEKHRDFPYFTFYSYLLNLEDEILIKIGKNLNDAQKEHNEDFNFVELYEIYFNVINKKKISIEGIEQIFTENYNESDRANTVNNTTEFSSNFSVGEESYLPNYSIRPESYNYGFLPKNAFSSKGILIKPNSQSYSLSYLYENNCSKIKIINETPLFKPSCKPKSPHILSEFCYLLTKCFPSKEDIKTKNIQQILKEVDERTNIQQNIQPIRELLSQLKIIRLSSFKNQKEKLCFWLNAFNFLSLFAIFNLKLNLTKKGIWKNFFHNIKFNIGGYNFAFDDMLYIIFQKNIFFQNDEYIPRDYVKKNIINLEKENLEFIISPLLLFLPNKEFFKPIIYDEQNLGGEIEKRYSNYFFCFIRFDINTQSIAINELILIIEPDFLGKGIKKYKAFIDSDLYKIIKKKKYNKISTIPFKWEISFDYLIEEAFIET